jgi:hypothetical protein
MYGFSAMSGRTSCLKKVTKVVFIVAKANLPSSSQAPR